MFLHELQANRIPSVLRVVVLLMTFLYSPVIVHANSNELYLKFNKITIENGLPQNSVFSIVKDKYGFMWFGTWGGAVRYDGNTCKVFKS